MLLQCVYHRTQHCSLSAAYFFYRFSGCLTQTDSFCSLNVNVFLISFRSFSKEIIPLSLSPFTSIRPLKRYQRIHKKSNNDKYIHTHFMLMKRQNKKKIEKKIKRRWI